MTLAVGFLVVSAVAFATMLSSDRALVTLAKWSTNAELNGKENLRDRAVVE